MTDVVPGDSRGSPPRDERAFSRRLVLALAALLRAQASNARQGLAALLVATAASLGAGLALGAMTGTLEELVGLIVLVPAAIGMRGQVFGALGARLGTAIHTGEFRDLRDPRGVVGQNVTAALVLTLYLAVALAVLARAVTAVLGVESISLLDFLVVSVVGAALSTFIVLAVTVGMAVASVRRGWDLDNVATPVVTAAGDVTTIPALWAATFLLAVPVLPGAIGAAALAALAAVSVYSFRIRARRVFRAVLVQSLPILVVAALVSLLAGITIEQRAERFFALPALLVLVPPFLADAGALGGILSARLTSKLHLGTLAPTAVPGRRGWDDVVLVYLLAVPVFAAVGLSVTAASDLVGLAHAGYGTMVALTLMAGLAAVTAAVAVAYWAAVAAFRLGLDPDNYGIPMITSAIDFLGTAALVGAIVILGVA